MKAKVLKENEDISILASIEKLLQGTSIPYKVNDLKQMLEPETIYYDVMDFLTKVEANVDEERAERIEQLVYRLEDVYS